VKRRDLEHLIRAAGDIADDHEIVVIGSQAILGSWPDAPEDLLASVEADLFPKNHPERSDLIDGTIGEASPFHATFGYYGQGVDRATATLPSGWESRLVAVRNDNTRGVTGWCLEPHDLLISKYVAGREKDRVFTAAAARTGRLSEATLLERLAETDLSDEHRRRIAATIRRDFGTANSG